MDEQESTSRLFAAAHVAEAALDALAVELGDQALARLEAMRVEIIARYKNSVTPPEHDLRQAELVRPALDVIDTLFNGAILRNSLSGRT